MLIVSSPSKRKEIWRSTWSRKRITRNALSWALSLCPLILTIHTSISINSPNRYVKNVHILIRKSGVSSHLKSDSWCSVDSLTQLHLLMEMTSFPTLPFNVPSHLVTLTTRMRTMNPSEKINNCTLDERTIVWTMKLILLRDFPLILYTYIFLARYKSPENIRTVCTEVQDLSIVGYFIPMYTTQLQVYSRRRWLRSKKMIMKM